MAWVGAGGGKDDSNILAWAQNIPAGAVPQNDIIPFSPPTDSSLPSSSRSSMKSKASSPSRSNSFRPPSLLQPVAPSLCMSTPHAARPKPSLPILTPQQHIATLTGPRQSRRKSLGDLSASAESSMLISPPDSDDGDDQGVPDFVYASAQGKSGVQEGVMKAAHTFNHAKTYLAGAIRSWYSSSLAAPSVPLPSRADAKERQQKSVTPVARTAVRAPSPHRSIPLFPQHRSKLEATSHAGRVPSPLHLPDEDLQMSISPLCQSQLQNPHAGNSSQIPYPSPSSSSFDARERRPVGVQVESLHPAFLTRGRKGRS
ncbi:hypothetical protein GLOTRDRAFT_110787 [Gloeophyllum trabeum ATCC 11539]|uniref:Uncharacterized protein n=1 Tax=Gloeophyllum trabeum (strain ATCC 11539 / FP-39264 / Madison 617) TaxID=670483 RepID=S7QA70_GLOTA|nr:uncharacterized protein GLOTRDRAFT_110787 [Gloeophyllum trabeum ATCC 11539]EPQ56412.1 hypothetical protein GLOTRDRAFT_110787 [Gloeophyllum trabeum ATCC 11539]